VFCTKIRVKGKGGHGSIPIKKENNAMYKISKITQKIIEYKYPIEITEPVREMAQLVSLPGIAKKLLTSKRLIRPSLKLVEKFMGETVSNLLKPFVMDILNPTGFKASEKVNVIPQSTELIFDCRLLPGHDRETIKNLLRKILGKKLFSEIEIIPIEPTQPATVNSIENPFWDIVENIMEEMHKGAKLVPMLSAGSTDSKFIRERGGYSLGFSPMRMDPNMSYSEMSEMAHGKNERMWIPNLSYSMEFFYRLIKKF
ncbi:MAG: M20/M25/M40 family metallo-hydrolase, partial [Promethearchaeota archaeon]